MGSIVVFENVSLDGVIQDPTGEEGFSPYDWRADLTPAERRNWDTLLLDDAQAAQALLLGRRTYDFFAARYPHRVGELADRINGLPKYVVSGTLAEPRWNNSTVLTGSDTVAEVSKLKETVNGEIRVYASSQLVQTLIEHHLVDELRLIIFPLVMGAGNRLFGHASNGKPTRPRPLSLVDARSVGERLAYLTYRCIAPTD
jgi:dihydrofolate reductase